ncbi:MAG TPA: toll/interleukin-1 receptor domain-containing protein [Longimicrobium sp.]|jgi:hypothetical protein|uniref:toll/interleukin-1 receptor domain-containing protein n=1 Tax=Longimicrobium sp. TaxID=2029185 RepID=UPI002EDB0E39
MEYRYDLFISYSSRDRSTITRLAQALTDKRFHIWLDEHEIGVGDRISRKIGSGIKESRYLALWLTDYSIRSRWVAIEWEAMLHSEIVDDNTRVLPLLGEACDIPVLLQDKRYVDFSKSFEEGLDELICFLDGRTSVTIEECVQGLIDGREASVCAEKLGALAIRGRDELALQALWDSAQQTTKPFVVVDHCCWYIGRIVIESCEPNMQDAGLRILEESITKASDIIIDKFAYTAGEIALQVEDPALKRRVAHFIEQCTTSDNLSVKKWYTITKDRIREHDSFFFENVLH